MSHSWWIDEKNSRSFEDLMLVVVFSFDVFFFSCTFNERCFFIEIAFFDVIKIRFRINDWDNKCWKIEIRCRIFSLFRCEHDNKNLWNLQKSNIKTSLQKSDIKTSQLLCESWKRKIVKQIRKWKKIWEKKHEKSKFVRFIR